MSPGIESDSTEPSVRFHPETLPLYWEAAKVKVSTFPQRYRDSAAHEDLRYLAEKLEHLQHTDEQLLDDGGSTEEEQHSTGGLALKKYSYRQMLDFLLAGSENRGDHLKAEIIYAFIHKHKNGLYCLKQQELSLLHQYMPNADELENKKALRHIKSYKPRPNIL